jgi:predicted aldo/keto reductase-like oxidoreductase
MSNFVGNGSKSLHESVNASLKKLQTDYIDVVCQLPLLGGYLYSDISDPHFI